MRVLYDHQIFQYQHFGGISRYFYELFKYYGKSNEVTPIVPFKYTHNEYLLKIKDGFNFSEPIFLGKRKFPGKGKLTELRNKYFPKYDTSIINLNSVINNLQGNNYDIFHPTYFDNYFLNYIGTKPFVITVYDLIYEKYSNYFPKSDADTVLANKNKLIYCANHIIAISESVKRDLLDLYKIDENKISVIQLGNSLFQNNIEAVALSGIPEKYILYVGNRSAYKNFVFFIQSIRNILRNDKEIYIVCTGKKFSSAEKLLFRKLDIEKQLVQRFVSDSELTSLYKNAKMFVFPSLYEGFGIPVLEAMSNGCPVALSNTSSLPEVGGEAALYFNPENADSIYSTVHKCLYDDKTRSELKRKGIDRVKLFSWEKTAKDTANVYRQVLSNI